MIRAILLAMLCVVSASAASAQQLEWAKIPRMQLERQFAGPFQDTIIQRWRDPVDGSICYLYIPFTVSNTPPQQPDGYVQYGNSNIGSISCTPSRITPPPAEKKSAPAAKNTAQ